MTIKNGRYKYTEVLIRPSTALRNNYSEISRTCREDRTPVIITKNGIGDTVLMGIQEYNQMTAELELLRTLADAEEDIAQGRVAPVQETSDDIRSALLAKGNR